MASGARWEVRQCGSDWSLGQGPVQQPSVLNLPRVHKFGSGSSIVATDSLSHLKALLALEDSFDNVCLDRGKAPGLSDREQWRQWVHGTLSLLDMAQRSLRQHGRALVHVDSRDLVIVLRLATQCALHLVEVLAWGKKYAGQQVTRTVEPLHDLILVFACAPSETVIESTFLPWRIVGKSEDATREFRESVSRASRPGLAPPPALKPQSLYRWLVHERLLHARRVLDLTSCGGSFSEHLRDLSIDSVDVLWVDTDWTDSSAYLVADRLGLDEELVIELIRSSLAQKTNCFCKLALVGELRSHSAVSDVRVRQAPNIGGPYVTGSEAVVEAAIEHFFGASVELFDCHVSSAPSLVGGIRVSLTSTGLAIIDLEGNWQADALAAADALGPEVEFGQLVVPEGLDDVCGMVMSLLFMKDGALARAVGSEGRRPIYGSPDNDPRGAWRDPRHKGAKSGGPGTSFAFNWPPYRWKIMDGELPPGLWRLSPETGVVWGIPTNEGEYEVVVEVSDSKGATAQARLVFTIVPPVTMAAESATGPDLESIWWLNEARGIRGPLRVTTTCVQMTRGVESSRALRATGGAPDSRSVDPPGEALERGRTRYWEFSLDSFVRALQQDAVIFPAKSGTRPRIKKFERQGRSVARSSLPSVLSPAAVGERSVDIISRILREAGTEVVMLQAQAVSAAGQIRVSHEGEAECSWEAFSCTDCSALSSREDGCSAQHAVQHLSGLVPATEEIAESPVDLITLDGRPGGVLIPQQPVTEQSLRSILSGRIELGRYRVLARRREKSLSATSKVKVISWPS